MHVALIQDDSIVAVGYKGKADFPSFQIYFDTLKGG